MSTEDAISRIRSDYKAGSPNKTRFIILLIRYAPPGQMKAIDQRLRETMGMAYPYR